MNKNDVIVPLIFSESLKARGYIHLLAFLLTIELKVKFLKL